MGQVVYRHNISFQFLQHNESNHLHKTRTCDKLMQTFSNQTTNHRSKATNCFFGNDSYIAMFHWISLNCEAMTIWRWWAPLYSLDTILAHTFLIFQSLKSQKKWLILDNPKGLTNINIWTSEATWRCVSSRSREIHMIMPMWIALRS
jgi:hypothetical protein